jgi:hypothetical protein
MAEQKQVPIDGDNLSSKREVVRQSRHRTVLGRVPHQKKQSIKKKRRSRHPIQTFEDNMGAEQPHAATKRGDGDIECVCEFAGETISRNSESFEDNVTNSVMVSDPQKKRSAIVARSRHAHHKMRTFLKELLRFKVLKAFQIICAVYIAIVTICSHLRDPETGLIVDRASDERTEHGLILDHGVERAIVASSTFQVACIFIARLTAWFMYPSKYYAHSVSQASFHTIALAQPLIITCSEFSLGLCISHQVSGYTNPLVKVTTCHSHELRLP